MASSLQTDVLIVGGGPAGAATALGLLTYSGLRVLIVESSDLSAVRVGEQVDPSLFDLLAYLQITREQLEEDSFIQGYNTLSAWGSSHISSRSSITSSREAAYQLDREKFDLLLLGKAAEKGAVVMPRARCMHFQQSADGHWTVQVKHQTRGELSVQARYVVDATGRQSSIARQLGIGAAVKDQLVAVGAFLQVGEGGSVRQEVMLETVEEGWWYCATLPNRQVVTTLFSDADMVKERQLQKPANWNALLARTVHVKQRVANSTAFGSPWVRGAFSKRIDTTARPHFMAVGDAAASFDPVSSLGIGFAVSSGCHAARALCQLDEGDGAAINTYQQSIDTIFDQYLSTKATYYSQEKRWLTAPFWQRRTATTY
ncbi:lysine-epsilon-oxidase maturase LodB [Fibrella aquatilis]|uniref:Lysine-epsilon-oxidase maturase LodB n=1 Tax=Fibrella aquatilis TaxID=2817059 RepID=A0A939G4T8_9BACT|nr:lysine-epsilon-oxidase maturase LodB [Fibrella aquatilis]MBO0930242.1 lysine-epsilon-oxidase maturase LodB [Fibrella aquatilis]